MVVVALGGFACSEPDSPESPQATGQSDSTASGNAVTTGLVTSSGDAAASAAVTGSGSTASSGTVTGSTGEVIPSSSNGDTGGPAGVGGATTTGSVSTGSTGTCDFQVTQSLSEAIGSVGIVEFSVNLPAVDAATIEFGLDTSYGMTAPVDVAEPNYRTLLLGMKTASEYHFRITATSGSEQCVSSDYSLTTAARPDDVVAPTIDTPLPDQHAGGFLIASRWGTDNGGPAFILDADNDLVWWYFAPIDVMRARMSFDGKSLWLRNTAQEDGTGVVMRLSMDGLTEERWEVPRTTHDLAVLPDGKVGLIAHTDGCDEIVELDPDTGATASIFNVEQAHGKTNCHVNYLAYSAIDDSYYISDYAASSYIKISRSGELRWVMNGDGSTITGSAWQREHGIHVLSADHFVIFSNGSMDQNSLVLEYQLDESANAVTELWRYDAGVNAQFGGDVQRLENGNTLAVYSSMSLIQEVNADGALVQELAYPSTHTVAYAMKRPTLYGGPPPKIYEFVAGAQ